MYFRAWSFRPIQAFSLAVLSIGVASTVRAQGNSAALEAFRQGTALFGEGNYVEAADAFRKAYEIQPSWKLWFNIGQCEAAAKRYGFAVEAFESYLAEGGDDVPAERKMAVLSELEELRIMTGFVEVTAPNGAVIVVDGVTVGIAPLPGRVRLAAGTPHVIEVVEGDRTLLVREVQVSGAEVAKVDAPVDEAPVLENDGREASFEPVKLEPKSHSKVVGIWGGVLVGLGAAALVAGGVTGGMALSKDSDLESKCPGGVCDPDRQDDVESRDALATTSTVCFIGGGVVLATGAALVIAHIVGKEPSRNTTGALMPYGLGISGVWRF